MSPEVFGNGPTRVMLALLAVYQRDGRATIPSVTLASGYRSKGTVHHHLATLLDAGLVAQERGAVGTLRPVYTNTGSVVRWPENRVDRATRERPRSRPEPLGGSDVPHHNNPPPGEQAR